MRLFHAAGPDELLSQVSYGGGGSSTMVWDADQQRQKLTNSGGSTHFVYDPTAGVPTVLVETDGENETFYVREPGGELIARATGQDAPALLLRPPRLDHRHGSGG